MLKCLETIRLTISYYSTLNQPLVLIRLYVPLSSLSGYTRLLSSLMELGVVSALVENSQLIPTTLRNQGLRVEHFVGGKWFLNKVSG